MRGAGKPVYVAIVATGQRLVALANAILKDDKTFAASDLMARPAIRSPFDPLGTADTGFALVPRGLPDTSTRFHRVGFVSVIGPMRPMAGTDAFTAPRPAVVCEAAGRHQPLPHWPPPDKSLTARVSTACRHSGKTWASIHKNPGDHDMTSTRPILAALLLATLVSPALAQPEAQDWTTKEQVVQKLADAGFSKVAGLKATDGYWEGSGVKDGNTTRFFVAPRSDAPTDDGDMDE